MKKRILSMLLAVVMLLGMFPGVASAADSVEEALGEVDIYNGGQKLSYLSINGRVRELIYTYYNYVDRNGNTKEIPAYCVNPNTKGVPQTVAEGESIKYLAEEIGTDPKVMGIIANGYPHRGLGELKLENKYQAYYATKMALWCYLLSHWDINNLKVNPDLTGVELERANKMLAAAKDIYRRGTAWSTVLSPNVTVEPDQEVAYPATVNGQEYLQQIFTVTSDTWVCDYTINVAFTDPSAVPAGTKIVDMNNREIDVITTEATGQGYSGQFKVLYPAGSVEGQSGSVQLSFRTNVYKYAIYYAVCAETDKYGNLQNYMVDTDPTTPLALTAYSNYTDTVNWSNSLRGSLDIRIVRPLKFIGLASYTFSSNTTDKIVDKNTYTAFRDRLGNDDHSQTNLYGSITQNRANRNSYVLRGHLAYNDTFKEKHTLSVIAGADHHIVDPVVFPDERIAELILFAHAGFLHNCHGILHDPFCEVWIGRIDAMRKCNILPAVRSRSRSGCAHEPRRTVRSDDRAARPHAVGADPARRNDCLFHIFPMYHVRADPVRPAYLRPIGSVRIALIEQVIITVIIERRMRLVHPHPGRDRMILRAVPVALIYGRIEHDVRIFADRMPRRILVGIQRLNFAVRELFIIDAHFVQKPRNKVTVDPVNSSGIDILANAQRIGGSNNLAAGIFVINLFIYKLAVQIETDMSRGGVVRSSDMAPRIERKIIDGIIKSRGKIIPRFGIF